MGIFFCWSKRYLPAKRCLVYPQPLDLIALPTDSDQAGKQENKALSQPGNEDFNGMKQYQVGDRIRDIHWPSVSKTNKLVTIEYESLSPSSLNLSWLNLPASLNTEDKLSQLTFWLIEAEKSGAKYQLEMPNNTISYDSGATHFRDCLKVLALWELPDTQQNAKAKASYKTKVTKTRVLKNKSIRKSKSV